MLRNKEVVDCKCWDSKTKMHVSHVCRFLLWALFVWIQESLTDGQTIFNEHDESFIGCFTDNAFDRVFPVRISQTILVATDFTVKKCIDQCIALSVAFAAVQYQSECYCGDASTDYDRLGELPLDDCKVYRCLGNQNQYCGGINALLVYNISSKIPPQATTPQTSDSTAPRTSSSVTLATTTGPTTTSLSKQSSTAGTAQTTMPPVPPQQMDTGNIALYAGAGGGGAFVVILIVLIVVAVIYKKRRNEKVNRICSSSGQPLSTIGSGSRVSTSRDNGVDVRDVNDEKRHQCGQPVPGGITYEEISYADGKPDFDETTGDVAALHVYNMPDISPGTPSGPERYTAPNGRDLYTLPDKEQGNQNATQNGDSRHYDISIDNLYAMPDKSRGATELDPTLMIENDIYGSS